MEDPCHTVCCGADGCNDRVEILGADTKDLCWGVADEGALLDVNSGIAVGQKFWILAGNE